MHTLLSYAEADAQIRLWERAHDLLRFRLDGWTIWPLFRFAVSLELCRVRPRMAEPPGWWRPGAAWIESAQDFLAFARLRPVEVVTLTYDLYRTEWCGNRFHDVIFDDLLDTLGSQAVIEFSSGAPHERARRMAHRPPDLRLEAYRGLVAVLKRLIRHPEIPRLAKELGGILSRLPGLARFEARYVEVVLAWFSAGRRLYRTLFRRLRPRYFLLTTAYTEHPAVAAAKELGITTIEFQHGVLDRHHAGYSWDAYALPYRDAMPVPDRLFVYGDYWRDELVAGGFWKDEPRSVGSLRFDRHRPLESATRPLSSGFFPSSLKGPLLVCTTQGLDSSRVAAFLASFLDRAATQGFDCRLAVKCHPGEPDGNIYLEALGMFPNARVISGAEQPDTFTLLAAADLHLSIASTCHYEALGMGVPTVVLPFLTSEVVEPLVVAGHALRLETPDQLLALLSSGRLPPVSPSLRERLFRPGACAAMRADLAS